MTHHHPIPTTNDIRARGATENTPRLRLVEKLSPHRDSCLETNVLCDGGALLPFSCGWKGVRRGCAQLSEHMFEPNGNQTCG